MTSLLVTGLTGLVASRFQELYAPDFDFTNIDLATGIDITNKTAVHQAITASSAFACIHFAAFTNVDAAQEQNGNQAGPCYQINVLGTRYVAQSCAQTKKYLIHISTDFVFDGVNPPRGGYTETDTPHPIEWYGQTKLWAEEEVAKSGSTYCIARITYPFRACYPPRTDLVRNILDKLKAGNLPPMFTDHIITPTFIDDIAVALKTILDQRPTGIFHVVGANNLSDYQIAQKVARVFGLDEAQVKPTNLKDYLKTAPRPYQKNLTTSNAKLQRELGISMRTLDAALLEMKRQLNHTSKV